MKSTALRLFSITILLASLLFAFTHSASAAVIVVNPGGGGNFTTIQAAVNNAAPGDVIAIKAGTYAESVDLSLMGSAIGGPRGALSLVSVDGQGLASLSGAGYKLHNSGVFGASLVVDGLKFSSQDNDAVHLTDVTDLTIINSLFSVVGNDGNLHNAIDLARSAGGGFVTLFNNTFNNIESDIVLISVSGTGQGTLTITENTFTDDNTSPKVPDTGVTLFTSNSASVRASVVGNTFSNLSSGAVAASAVNSAVLNTTIKSNTISNLTNSGPTIEFSTSSTASSMEVIVADNTITNISSGSGIDINPAGSSQLNVWINRNTMTNLGPDGSDRGISISADATRTGLAKIDLENNTVNGAGGSGLRFGSLGNSTYELTVRNNNIQNLTPIQSGGDYGIRIGAGDSGINSNVFLTLVMSGNTVAANNIRLSKDALNAGQFRLEGNPGLSVQQNVDTANTNPGGPAIINGTISVILPGIVVVPAENRPPSAADDLANGSPGATISILGNDSDPDGISPSLDFFTPTSSRGGSVVRDQNGTPANLTDDRLVYTAPAGFSGSDTLYYVVGDGISSDPAKVTVTVTQPTHKIYLPVVVQ